MIADEVGKSLTNAYKKIDQAWDKMSEDAAEIRREQRTQELRNPEVYGNQTDVKTQRDLNNEIKGIPEPSEALASATAERELSGDWQKI